MSRFTSVIEFGDVALYNGTKAIDGFAREILEAMERQLTFALAKHSQVLLTIMTINYPREIPTNASTENACFQRFVQAYVRWLNANGFDPQYIWVRENGASGQLHYHLALLLDGNVIRYMYSPKEANVYWSRELQRAYAYGGVSGIQLTDFGGSHSLMVQRGDQAAFNQAMGRLSYLAKLYSKYDTGAYIKGWSQSQIG